MLKKILKKLWENKNWAWIILVLFGIGNTIYFAIEYNNQNQFSEMDGFVVNSQTINNFILYTLVIWLFIERHKIYGILNKIYNQIIENEDDNVKLHRDTQDLIIRMFKKDKGDSDEKE